MISPFRAGTLDCYGWNTYRGKVGRREPDDRGLGRVHGRGQRRSGRHAWTGAGAAPARLAGTVAIGVTVRVALARCLAVTGGVTFWLTRRPAEDEHRQRRRLCARDRQR